MVIIFFCCQDDPALVFDGGESLGNTLRILAVVAVMVGECQHLRLRINLLQLSKEALGRAYATKSEYGPSALKRMIPGTRSPAVITQGGKVQRLPIIESQGLTNLRLFVFSQIRRTFRNDDDVGALFACRLFPQSAVGQHTIVVDRSAEVHHHDRQARCYSAMLEGIVQQNKVGLGKQFQQSADAFAPVLLHGHFNFRKLAEHL